MNDDWCLLLQKLVCELGWTPVVGCDPMCGVSCPPLVPEAIAIDFNATLGLPTLFMRVPLEFAFLWLDDRLAFWHSELLLPRDRLARLAKLFVISDLPQQAHVVSHWGNENRHSFFVEEMCHGDESSAVSGGLSMAEFLQRYGSEAQCAEALARQWLLSPDGQNES